MDDGKLEDWAFGPPEDDGTGAGSPLVEWLLPITSVIVLLLVVLYSMCKCTQYHELMQTHPSLQHGLLLVNSSAILLTTTLVAYTAHRQGSCATIAEEEREKN
jgi:hypothetical protein